MVFVGGLAATQTPEELYGEYITPETRAVLERFEEAGGAVLFGLNYGIFLLKIKMGDAFNTTLAFLLLAALFVGCIYVMKKK